MNAQEKYALLVGINQYYVKPGVKSNSRLQGCINDAMSVKAFLKNRFAFKNENITMLTDEQASSTSVLNAFEAIRQKCRTGDAFVFYFSGHGVWMTNDNQNKLDIPVKEGMNQAMVMSNMYAENLNALITDAKLKKIFNRFVDKKVVVTSLIDCCFSGKLVMGFSLERKNPYSFYPPSDVEKSLGFDDVIDAMKDNCLGQVNGCINDSIIANFVNDNQEVDSTRAVNLRDNITISDNSVVTRPSERKNSRFLSIGASNDRQKSIEILDERGVHHGAFTKALLEVYKKADANIPASEAISKLKSIMKKQLYEQQVLNYQDPQRLKENLIGLKTGGGSRILNVGCSGLKGETVILNAGLLDGLAPGNILENRKAGNTTKIKVTEADKNNAKALVIAGTVAKVAIGDLFTLVNQKTTSAPILKIYVPTKNISGEGFNQFFNTSVIPLTAQPKYWDYKNWFADTASVNLFYNDPKSNANVLAKKIIAGQLKKNFFVFLPIPKSTIQPFIDLISKNPNFKIVNKREEAELELYLNYAKQRGKEPAAFYFTWYKFNGKESNDGMVTFNRDNVRVQKISTDAKFTAALANELNLLSQKMIRNKTRNWMNMN